MRKGLAAVFMNDIGACASQPHVINRGALAHASQPSFTYAEQPSRLMSLALAQTGTSHTALPT